MKTLKEAVVQFKKFNPDATADEINAFIQGWTAHEVETELKKGKI